MRLSTGCQYSRFALTETRVSWSGQTLIRSNRDWLPRVVTELDSSMMGSWSQVGWDIVAMRLYHINTPLTVGQRNCYNPECQSLSNISPIIRRSRSA